MNEETDQRAQSRRERPAKPALTREGIVAAAVRIFRADGLSKVTMRSVAQALDTGHASLYVYVKNTEDLHAQVLDAELSSLALPDAGRPWRDSLITLLIDYGNILLSHAEIARMAIRTRPNGPNSAALVEAILAQLARGGVTGLPAAWGVDVLLQYPTAVAAEHGDSSPAGSPPTIASQTPDTHAPGPVDPKRYPHTAAVAEHLVSGTPQSRAEWAINVLIDGLLTASGHTNNRRQP